MTKREIIQLLKIHDCLVANDVDKAYEELYRLADPGFESRYPWKKWEDKVGWPQREVVEKPKEEI